MLRYHVIRIIPRGAETISVQVEHEMPRHDASALRLVRSGSGRDLVLALGAWALLAALAAPVGAQEHHDGPAPQIAASQTVTGSVEDRPLTRAEEKSLLIEMRRSRGWDLEELARQGMMEEVLGKGRSRRLDEARFHFQLYAGEPHFADPLRDPELFDRKVEREVLGAYKKLARESLERAIGLEDWWDAKRRDYRSSFDDDRERGGHRSAGERSWRARVSPRLADDHVGVKMKLPHTGLRFFDHLSFRAYWEIEDDRPTFTLKFDDDIRYLNLDIEPDTEERGDEVRLHFRLLW